MANRKDQNDSELERVLSEVNDELRKSKTNTEEADGENKTPVSHLRGSSRSAAQKEKEGEGHARRTQKKSAVHGEEEQLSFSKAATIIEDGLDEQGDRVYPTKQSRNVIEPPTPEPEEEPEQEPEQPRHIAVTAGEVVEPPPEAEKEAKKPKVSKAALKKAHGTAVSREIKKEKKTVKQKRTMVLGVFIAFFVIVGIVATIWSGVEIGVDLATSAPLKEELAMEIFPLVIIDTPEFENPTMLDNTAIVSASVWGFIVNEKDKSKYRRDDLGNIFVPEIDIEKHMRRLFGQDVTIKHQSVEDTSVQMVYDAENKQYIIESTPRFLPYTPRVDNLIKTGEIYTLKVSYILPTVVWNLEKNLAAQPSDKILEYRLLKKDDTYQVLSVKLLEVATASDYLSSQRTESDALLDDGYDESSSAAEEGTSSAAAAAVAKLDTGDTSDAAVSDGGSASSTAASSDSASSDTAGE